MQQSFINILLTDAAVKAVCWTLVHSLWQGLVAALVAGVIILTTRKSAAVLRYNFLTADLVLFLVATVGIFSYEFRQDGAGASAGTAPVVVVDGVRVAGGQMGIHARYDIVVPSMLERVGMFLNEHAGVVVIVWMVCLLVQLLGMTGGLYRMHQLRRQRVFLPAECWDQRMSVLMGRLGIKKKVRLLQSGSVAMPVTFGFLKPSILVPLGMLANLPAEQVETILLHELAHIRRSDYLANLLLHIGEAVFFFNPGVRWVAWLIREEREACCDDLVLAGVKDRNSYFEALIAFGEYAIGRGSMAMPLGNGKSDLLWRIRRMLNHENKKLHLMEKTILSFGLMAVVAIGLVSMKQGDKVVVSGRPAAVRVSVGPSGAGRVTGGAILDTVPVGSGKMAVKALVLTRDTTGASAAVVDSMSFGMTAPGPNAITIQISGKNVSAQTAATMAATVMNMANTMTTTTKTAVAVAPVTTIIARAGSPVAPVTTIISSAGEPVAPVTEIVAPVGDPIAPVTAVAIAVGDPVTPATTIVATVGATSAPVAAIAAPVAATGVVPPPPPPPVVKNDWIKPIIEDLKAKELIKGVDPLAFRLDEHGLTVNGVKVSVDVFAFFRDKYITYPENSFYYRHRGGSTSATVNVY
jgi:beta-lactamase regulating signal transducer with metallopeptidase domain